MENKPPKIYIASPLGFSEAGRSFLYQELEPTVRNAGYDVLDPWKLTSQDTLKEAMDLPYGPAKRDMWREVNKIIGGNNVEAIRISDGILAILDGVDVDSGAASEIGYAAALGKPVLGYRSDFRLSSDNEGSTVNLQVEYFIRMSGGRIVNSLDMIVRALQEIIPLQ